jgi:hypothetical protein
MGGIYVVEMGSGGMICIPGFIKIRSGIQTLIRGGYTERQQDDRIRLHLFFQNKESRQK